MDPDEVVKQLQTDFPNLREQLDINQHRVAFLSKALNQQEVESLYNEVQVLRSGLTCIRKSQK